MPFEFEDVSIEEIKQRLATRTRTSKWREELQSFVNADKPAIRLKPSGDEEWKPGSVASGLNNALKAAKDAGSAFPVEVKQRRTTDGDHQVFLIRTDMVDLKPAAAAPAEAE